MQIRSLAIFAGSLVLVGAAFAQTAPARAPKPVPGTPAEPAAEAAPPTIPETAVVLSAGDQKMTRQQFEDLLKAMPAQARAQASGAGKRQLGEMLAESDVLAQEARKRRIDDRPDVKEITQFQVNRMLAGFLYEDLLEGAKPDEAAIKDYYEKHKAEYDEAKIQHILVRFKGSRVPLAKGEKDLTPEEALAKAQDIKKKLDGGADFAELAKADSDDKTSGAKGGQLGEFIARQQLDQTFATAAFALPVGQISEPVKTAFGYHIIKVSEKRTRTLEDEREAIVQKLKPEMAQKQMEAIRKQYPASLNPEFFPEAKAPARPTLTPSLK